MALRHLLTELTLPALIVALGTGGLMWLSAEDAPPARVARQPPPLPVETVTLQDADLEFPIHVNGNVVPHREVTLSSEVAGAVVFKNGNVDGGRHVPAGLPLLQIDPERYRLQVDALESELEQVVADLRRLSTEEEGTGALIRLVEREAEITAAASRRLAALAEKGVATDEDKDLVERAELQARNTLRVLVNERELMPVRRERLEAQKKLIELRRQQAQLNLDRCRFVAPFAGALAEVHVEQGDYVQAGDPLLTLEDTSSVDVECSLQMEDLYWLWNSKSRSAVDTGQAGEIGESEPPAEPDEVAVADRDVAVASGEAAGNVYEVPSAAATVTATVAGRQFHWSGRLTRFQGRGVNRRTRTVLCRVTVDRPVRSDMEDGPPALLRGMFVTVTLHVAPRTPLLRLPAAAVQPDGQVLTVVDKVLRVHTVQIARRLPASVLVRADSTQLRPGDRLVVTQVTTPLDGSPVRELPGNLSAMPAEAGMSGVAP